MPLSYDASAVSAYLANSKQTKPLARMIKRKGDLYSIHVDLMSVRSILNIIRSNSVAPGDDTRTVTKDASLTDAALAAYAIILYSRATDTGSGVRGKLDPLPYYSNSLAIWHKEIIKLRNEAIGHFGFGSHSMGSMVEDGFYLSFHERDGHPYFDFVINRLNYRGGILNQLHLLTDAALAGIEDAIQKHDTKLIGEILKHAPALTEAAVASGPVAKHAPTGFTRSPPEQAS